jgi:hypothetical protein
VQSRTLSLQQGLAAPYPLLTGILIFAVASATAPRLHSGKYPIEDFDVLILRLIVDSSKDLSYRFERAGWRFCHAAAAKESMTAKCMQPSAFTGKQRSIRNIFLNWTCKSGGRDKKQQIMWMISFAGRHEQDTPLRG